MRRFRSNLVVALALLVPGSAIAADMPYGRGPVVIGEDGTREEEIGTGWYLRGDVGYGRAGRQQISYTSAGTTLSNPKGGDVGTYGIGFGYKFDMVRADVTLDAISDRRISWTRSAGCYDVTCATTSMNAGNQRITTLLANAYLDMGTWSGFTPYVGAGIGVAYGGTSINGYNTPYVTSSVPSATYSNSEYKTASPNGYSLAAAAMAGGSYTIGSGLMLDAGYRFLWADHSVSGRTSSTTTTVTNPDITGVGGGTVVTKSTGAGHLRMDDLRFHQFRVGLRYFVN